MARRNFWLVLTAAIFMICGRGFAGEEEVRYFALLMDKTKVGYSQSTRVERAGRVTTTEYVQMKLSRAGVPAVFTTTETCVETIEGKPLSFGSIQNMGISAMKISGTIDSNDMVDLKTAVMGNEQRSTMQWPRDAVMAEGLRLLEKAKGLKKGTHYSVKIFSPSLMQALDTEVTIGDKQAVDLLGRVVTLTEVGTKVTMPMVGEMNSVSYVDDDLNTCKNVMPIMGMRVEMVFCEKEYALSDVETYELFDKMFIKSPVEIQNISGVKSITYHLKPIKDANSSQAASGAARAIKLETIPSSDNQSVSLAEGGGVVVTVHPSKPLGKGEFPYGSTLRQGSVQAGSPHGKGSDSRVFELLKPTRFIQSDDKRIIELAKRAVGDANDAMDAAERIEKFVAGFMVNKDLSVGYASAVEVAESRQGDCSEFAVLTAALCRAVGIPARVAVGIAYVKSWGAITNGFGGHAWVEAYIGGKWVGLDSAFRARALADSMRAILHWL